MDGSLVFKVYSIITGSLVLKHAKICQAFLLSLIAGNYFGFFHIAGE